MKLRFLGTGAADWDWKNFPPGTRGSTATAVGDHILLDAGPTVWSALERTRMDASKITDLLITHSHSDHFCGEVVRKIDAASGKLTVRTSPRNAAKIRAMNDPNICVAELHGGDQFSLGEVKVTALPANHALPDLQEPAFHFLLEEPSRCWLYALDGAWMMGTTRCLLTGKKLDRIVWDATSGDHYNDWRFAEHNDLNMIDSMRLALTDLKIISDSTVHIFDHIARTLWPQTQQEQLKLAEQHRGLLAWDGMEID